MRDTHAQEAQRLLETVTDECTIWPHSLNSSGYPQGRVPGRSGQVLLHVVACELSGGPRPGGGREFYAAHTCGVKACINPAHLRWATPAENSQDRVGHGTVLRGAAIHQAKLTDDQVRDIYQDTRTQAVIAKEYGVHQSTVSLIKSGRSWTHATKELTNAP